MCVKPTSDIQTAAKLVDKRNASQLLQDEKTGVPRKKHSVLAREISDQ